MTNTNKQFIERPWSNWYWEKVAKLPPQKPISTSAPKAVSTPPPKTQTWDITKWARAASTPPPKKS